MAQLRSPASSISRKVRWRSIASGVVRTTGRRRACVVGQIGDFDRSATDDILRRERCDDALEVHRRASLPPRSAYGPAAYVVAVTFVGPSGGTPMYCRSKRAICWNAGAAIVPPQIALCGSSTITRTTSRGREAGTKPTNEAT